MAETLTLSECCGYPLCFLHETSEVHCGKCGQPWVPEAR